MPEADKQKINSSIEELREAIKKDELAAIKEKSENLKQASHKLAEMIYSQAQSQQASQNSGSSEKENNKASGEKPVEDADYEIVDDEEKK